jgi:hypothetical protein
MTRMRARLRSCTVAWLLCHVASYSALFPKDCCAAHAHRTPRVQEAAQPADQATCEMHHAEPAPEPAAEPECSLRGTCAGPMATLASLLSNQGVLPTYASVARDSSTETHDARVRENAVSLFISPDAPPPRA